MCGFVAIVGKSTSHELKSMASAVAIRGPDDRGELVLEGFSAIHHRLSIIGPDERGRQPMTVDGVTVVFNGCIYNHQELRAKLESDGVVFQSDTDTEVLPHLYYRFGFGMFSLLNGMFSIVLWDEREQQLTIARDAFGEKPLYVCEQNGRTGLASTLTAFEKGDWSLTPDIHAVHELLTTMRIESPRTMYQEISQLPAGCYATAKAGEPLRLRRYFFLPEPDQPIDLAPEEVEDEVARLLDDAFLMRTISDKPMGLFLSGGVDSSLIAASLMRQSDQPLHTFSVRFSDGAKDYDESAYAQQVATHLGCEHQTLEVNADAHETLEGLATSFDQPVTNAAALPMYLISREAKQYVDVALSGVGGDELFGGYPRYLGMKWHERLKKVPGRGVALSMLSMVGDSDSSRNQRGRLRRFLQGLDLNAADAYAAWMSTSDADWQQMLSVDQSASVTRAWSSTADAWGGAAGLLSSYGSVNGAMAYDVATYLSDDLLAMGDRMSMAHGLELRAPFLDTRLLSFVLTLDERLKVDGFPWQEKLKIMLKRIAARDLPNEVVYRPKQGFMAPVKHWLRGSLAAEVEALTKQAPLGGLVRTDFVKKTWQAHQAGADQSDMLWGLLLVDRWMKQRGWQF